MDELAYLLGSLLVLLLWFKVKFHWRYYSAIHNLTEDNVVDYVEGKKEYLKSFIKSLRFYMKFILPIFSIEPVEKEVLLTTEIHKRTTIILVKAWWLLAVSSIVIIAIALMLN